MKKVSKIIVYYTDGTFEEIRGVESQHVPDVVKTYKKMYNSCSVCGIILDGVMGYSCSNPICPTGLGPTMCSTTTANTSLLF